jgi:hypothetical protein
VIGQIPRSKTCWKGKIHITVTQMMWQTGGKVQLSIENEETPE